MRLPRRVSLLLTWPLLGLGALACIGDVEVPPDPPALFPVSSPTRRAVQRLEGTKPVGTAVLNHGEEVVTHDDEESWSFELSLVPGDNSIDLTSQRGSGLESVEHTRALLVYEPNFPGQPSLEPVASPTRNRDLNLGGTRPAETALQLRRLDSSGAVVAESELVPLAATIDWTAALQLADLDGEQRFSLVARDVRGRYGEPLDFTVVLDRQPPVLVIRYPLINAVSVPTNGLVAVSFDGALDQAIDSVDGDLLVLRDAGGARVTGVLSYHPLAHALVLTAALAASTDYTAVLDPTRVRDAAGNQVSSAPADWTWSFSTSSGEDGTTPLPPSVVLPSEVDPATGITTVELLQLSGTKPVWTSIWVNGQQLVPLDAEATWSAFWPLNVGENNLVVVARSHTDFSSAPTAVEVERELLRPAVPVLDPAPPETVSEPLVVLEGSREANTAILLNGIVVVPRAPDTSWVYNAELGPGVNELELRARNAAGVLSDPVRVLVDYSQPYQGPVPAGFKLIVSFGLRDLSGVQPISSSFDTGANRYSVDAWIEGPLEPGETCLFDASIGERQNIDYVATLVHYVGQKQGHTNPFWDADYRAPDFLAALVTGGVFESIGIPRTADRRSDSLTQGADLVDGSGRVRIANEDLTLIDGVTEATVGAGLKVLEWLPLSRDLQRVPQGEYLLRILISLDRDPGWVSANDTETCWGEAGFSARGQHRIVKRVSLGTEPFNITVGQATEESAPDTERGADQLRYLTPAGVTLRWVQGS